MRVWTPHIIKRWLYKDANWSFSADDQRYEIVWHAGRQSAKGSLAEIHRFTAVPKYSFSTRHECAFELSGGRRIDVEELPEAKAEELRHFLASAIPPVIAAHGERVSQLLDPWLHTVKRRLAEIDEVTPQLVSELQNLVPSPERAGLKDWNDFFDSSYMEPARASAKLAFPKLTTSPRRFLETLADEHSLSMFKERLSEWNSAQFEWIQGSGWISFRAIARRLRDSEAPVLSEDVADRLGYAVSDARAWLTECVFTHNKSYGDRQLLAKRPFFDQVESNPLTEEQATAVICMDDELLVVAAAGSGKSSTIVAKAGYAVSEGLCRPEDILMLAFNSDAAQELRKRIAKRLGSILGAERIRAETFHAFGLEVIGRATGKMPTPAPWLDAGEDITTIAHIVDALCEGNSEFASDWAMFRLVYFKATGKWDDAEEPEDYDPNNPRKRGFRTLQGEIVKSKAERALADWLFLHHVEYRYEANYEHDTRTPSKRQYRPDFYYPAIGVYHEHLALNHKGEAPPAFKGYLEGLAWKRSVHASNGTQLFETTSHDLRTGRAFKTLTDLFAKHGVSLKFDPGRVPIDSNPASPQAIARVMRVFQQHMKSGRRSVQSAYDRIGETPGAFVARLELFLKLYEQVAERWQEKLEVDGFVDFEDMLNMSADLIEAGRFPSTTQMILADEFQDSSQARMRMIEALIQQTGAQFTAVGDDWQGIYRFAGADISLMSTFRQRYPNAAVRHLSETFRSPQDLCDLTSAFVSKNPMQIQKKVRTHNQLKGPSARVYAFPDEESMQARLGRQFEALYERLADMPDDQRPVVLILGRYKKDRPAELAAWKIRYAKRLVVKFLTVHTSKGLEADWVVLLNVVQGTLGFPSQVEDDPILQLALPEPESYPFGEERRLLYVAMTRAKRSVSIYTLQSTPSQFLVELQEDHGLPMVPLEGEPRLPCPICGQGVLVDRVNRKSREVFKGCSRFPRCPPEKPESIVAPLVTPF